MAKKDRLLFFLNELQQRKNKELEGWNVKDLSSAIVLVEKLTKSKRMKSDYGKPPKTGKAKGGGEHLNIGDARGHEKSPGLSRKKADVLCVQREPLSTGLPE